MGIQSQGFIDECQRRTTRADDNVIILSSVKDASPAVVALKLNVSTKAQFVLRSHFRQPSLDITEAAVGD